MNLKIFPPSKTSIEKLIDNPVKTFDGMELTKEFVKKLIQVNIDPLEEWEFNPELKLKDEHNNCPFMSYEKIKAVQVAMNRIYIDRVTYTKHRVNLSSILLMTVCYIKNSGDHETMLTERLIEELIEMSDTCSTGFASRLVNVLSGIEGFQLNISWKDQVVSNLKGRMNSRIKTSETMTEILEQMTMNSSESRPEFLQFILDNIGEVREEMYKEFREYITDPEFDLYFRIAVSIYETGEE